MALVADVIERAPGTVISAVAGRPVLGAVIEKLMAFVLAPLTLPTPPARTPSTVGVVGEMRKLGEHSKRAKRTSPFENA